MYSNWLAFERIDFQCDSQLQPQALQNAPLDDFLFGAMLALWQLFAYETQHKDLQMSASNLDELLVHHLRDTLDAERQLTKALPKLAKAASNEELKTAFETHLAETEEQIGRLEQIFEMLGKPARGKHCAGMEGLIEEGKEVIEEDSPEAVTDAGLIAAAQKAEHYEIAAYGTMATYAKMLGMNDALKLLKQTLGEEKATDEKLSQLAASINFEAQHEEVS